MNTKNVKCDCCDVFYNLETQNNACRIKDICFNCFHTQNIEKPNEIINRYLSGPNIMLSNFEKFELMASGILKHYDNNDLRIKKLKREIKKMFV